MASGLRILRLRAEKASYGLGILKFRAEQASHDS